MLRFKINTLKNWKHIENILTDHHFNLNNITLRLLQNCFKDDRFKDYIYFEIERNKLKGYYNSFGEDKKYKLINTPKDLIDLIKES